ncbi:hypothetical protein GCM10009759_28580 [Kitasatospora saccharophila]|uniref:Uncharacterized protein n=1 Tax=Kitasatospora saccharophila TaxID=407973 RepID=A0ABN2WTK7_9ACTN
MSLCSSASPAANDPYISAASNSRSASHTSRTRPINSCWNNILPPKHRPPPPGNAISHPPGGPDGLVDRLHARARTDARPSVAHRLRHLFGPAACPDCDTAFRIADRVAAYSTY